MPNSETALSSELLKCDPRVAQAEQLLLEALHDAQASLTGPRPPQAAAEVGYQSLLERLAVARGGAT